MDPTTRLLSGNTDARVWAAEWCRIAREIEAANDGREVIDEGWMIGWFANAIMTGYDSWRSPVDPPFPPHDPDYPDVNPATGDERETTTGPATDPWDGPDDDEPEAA